MGESWQNRIDLAALNFSPWVCAKYSAQFLHPQADSPLRKQAANACKTRALRHNSNIPPHPAKGDAAGLRRAAHLSCQRQDEMFGAGANALMSGNYLTTKGIGLARDLEMLENLGFVVDRAR